MKTGKSTNKSIYYIILESGEIFIQIKSVRRSIQFKKIFHKQRK